MTAIPTIPETPGKLVDPLTAYNHYLSFSIQPHNVYMKASVSMKIYRSQLIHEIFKADSIDEVKRSIQKNLITIKKQDNSEKAFNRYVNYIIEELNDLVSSPMTNEHNRKLEAAEAYLRHLSMPVQ